MSVALPTPAFSGLVTQWALEPVVIVAATVLAFGYAWGVRRLAAQGTAWPARRSLMFALGLAVLVWTGSGFLQSYGGALYWVWTTQALVLLLGVPVILLYGRPLLLARAVRARGADRFLRSRAVRVLGNPLVGPAVVPVLSAVLFFGPLPGWAVHIAPVGWILHLVLVVIGALIMLPLVGLDERVSSLAVGLALAIGTFELVLDAIPGIVLRLHTTLATSYFDHRASFGWTPGALADQKIAGAVLWCVAEVIDLPFLLLVFNRWLKADALDAAEIDAVLDAERIARDGLAGSPSDAGDTGGRGEQQVHGPADVPWWLSDPAMRRRMGQAPKRPSPLRRRD